MGDGGTPITVGQYAGWSLIGAEQIAGGYEVAWESASTGQFTVWGTDTNGRQVSNLTGGNVLGSSAALESIETSFHQDLNGDGSIGLAATTIESFGSTSLVVIGNDYYFWSNSTGTGPELTYGGAPITVGEYAGWSLIGAEQIAGGYEVAWESASTGQFTVWGTDTNGKQVSNLTGGNVLGGSAALESIETSFHQDLNGDGSIGLAATTIESFGGTSLVVIGNDYYFWSNSTGTGPELTYGGAPITVGEYAGWSLVGAEQIAGGYEVAWESASTGQFTVWGTDTNGKEVSNLTGGVVLGTSATLASIEASFYQDLNQDGFIGTSTTVIEASGTAVLSVGPLAQAATIDLGASLELTGADNNSVTFSGATGTLIIDHSSMFTGHVAGLTGTGSIASSNVIDLRDVAFTSATENYAGNSSGGTLTVGDTLGHVANISLVGNYTNSTFTLFSDGKGGTFVIDPPIGQVIAGAPVVGNGGANSVRASSAVETSMPAEGAGYAPRAAAGSADRLSFNTPVVPNLDLVLNPLAGTAAQPTSLVVADISAHQVAVIAQPVHSAVAVAAIRPDDAAPNKSRAASFATSGPVAPGEKSQDVASSDRMVREVVSPNDVIRAINGGNIALKFGNGAGEAAPQHIWLFDEANGSLVPPARQAVRIVLDDHHHAGTSAMEAVEHAAGLLATATMISSEPVWLGRLRKMRRKAAGVLLQATKWTE